MTRIILKVEIFKEGDVYVSFCPHLNLSSYGETVEEARESLREAAEAFMEECERMGTLEEVLEEAGFSREGETWMVREPVVEGSLSLSL